MKKTITRQEMKDAVRIEKKEVYPYSIVDNVDEIIDEIFDYFEPKDKNVVSGIEYLNSKFTRAEVQRIGAECIGTAISVDLVARYVKYRIEIKKPLKTTRPLKAFIKKLIDADNKGYSLEQVVDIMMDNEWATFELEWIDKKMPKKTTQSALEEFGFNQNTQGRLE